METRITDYDLRSRFRKLDNIYSYGYSIQSFVYIKIIPKLSFLKKIDIIYTWSLQDVRQLPSLW